MAQIQPPPTTSQMTLSTNFLTKRWAQWFHSLYQKLGGSSALGSYHISTKIDDISVPSTVYVPVPHDGLVKKVYCAIEDTINGLPETVDVRNNSNTTIATISIPLGAPAGTVDSASPTTNNNVIQGQKVSLVSAGTSSTACPAWFVIIIEYT